MISPKSPRNRVEETIKIHLAARCPLLYLVSWEEERVLNRLLEIASDSYEADFHK